MSLTKVTYPMIEGDMPFSKIQGAPGSVMNYGAVGDGVTIDNAAFTAMANDLGYVLVPNGVFALDTCYIDVPIYFLPVGMITVPSGETVTIRNRISASSKQQIFDGDGDIVFEVDNALGIGEDSKHAYAAWWGIFPVGQTVNIQTALFNKALAAYTTQTREGIFELDIGSYLIDGTVTIPRGVHFKGTGTRRTIIDLRGNNYTVLQSGGSAVKITGIQFEQQAGTEAYFDGTQISLTHDSPVVEDVWLRNPRVGIYVSTAGTRASLTNVTASYTQEPVGGYPANSALIWAQGVNMLIENVRVINTTFGPDVAVLIGYGNVASITNPIISNVQVSEETTAVKIIADTGNISNVAISNVVFFGTTVDAVVEVVTSGATDVLGISMTNICANSQAAALLKMTQGSSGSIQAVSLGSGSAYSSSTKAANLIQTAGAMSRIVIAHGVAAWAATPPVATSGTITNLEIASYM